MLAINNREWGKEYDISGKEESNVYDLAKYVIELIKSNSQIKIYPAEIAQPQEVSVDISEIEKIGYKPKVPLKDGIKKTIEFYIEEIRRNPRLVEEV
jgi:nucleoside-diphosphate-sugar epimerase